jgi:hypothetical protein
MQIKVRHVQAALSVLAEGFDVNSELFHAIDMLACELDEQVLQDSKVADDVLIEFC